jgi:hypothetical protein
MPKQLLVNVGAVASGERYPQNQDSYSGSEAYREFKRPLRRDGFVIGGDLVLLTHPRPFTR